MAEKSDRKFIGMNDLNNLLTVGNLLSVVMALLMYSIRAELKHINKAIESVEKNALNAHQRIDTHIQSSH